MDKTVNKKITNQFFILYFLLTKKINGKEKIVIDIKFNE